MSVSARHTEWLSLVETSGPFLVPAVLNEVFPQGLEAIESSSRKHLRSAYDEWSDALDNGDPDLEALHQEWVRLALQEFLEFEESVFSKFDVKDGYLTYKSPEVDTSFAPDYLLKNGDQEKPLLLVSVFPPETDFEKVNLGDGWPISLSERMTLLCRHAGVRLGLLTNGERWMLVNAPNESSTGHTSWYARLWFQEPITLQAFQTLLGVRRFFGPEEERLGALLDKSLEQQEDVTNTLGEQVRRAVEVLVQALDRADQDRNRELLRDISPAELYEAGLTVMMRSVFILCAEERGLLLLGDETYDQCYAISTLRSQLAADADRYGPEILERRHDAWSRLLAVFRAVYGGIEHDALRMPALGGSLFDPDRFPFLEGRAKDTSWKDTPARPLPIDNRTVLLLLSALQVLEQRGGALLLSYKALDVEQIGHVYEGLLEHTVKRLPDTTLGFEGTKKIWNPNITLDELEALNGGNTEKLIKFLHEGTGRSKTAIKNGLKKEVDDATFGKIVAACGGDHELADRIRPYANLLRSDAWGDFIVYKANSYAVTSGMDRRETGTHYTPKSLTEVIVEKTLEPVAYIGPAEGKPREEWLLKKPDQLLGLKICDPAMGSGAFLVQVCRWLSRRLVEAWGAEEANGKFVSVDGEVLDQSEGQEPLPSNLDDRLLIAKRLIAERCLYGIDINPLAVELAKMSIWLITMSKGRPFGFLDHNLRSGDSLLGTYKLDQITHLQMHPEDGQYQLRIFGQAIEAVVNETIELRKRLRSVVIRDISDVETMAELNRNARQKLESVGLIADAMIGEALRCGGNIKVLETALDTISIMASDCLNGNDSVREKLVSNTRTSLTIDLPEGESPRRPLHWCLEFPEVFLTAKSGFDAFLGNPPFLGGKKIAGVVGRKYLNYLISIIGGGIKGSADLVVFFFLRAEPLLQPGNCIGLIACNSIAEGGNRTVGLEQLLTRGMEIFDAVSSEVWPGSANVVTSRICLYKGRWNGLRILNGNPVSYVSSYLTDRDNWTPKKLSTNGGIVHQGNVTLGSGFVLTESEAAYFIKKNQECRKVVLPYLRGQDLNRDPNQQSTQWVINFWDWSYDKARSQFPEVFSHVEKRVPAERSKMKSMGGSRKTFWLHLWNRSELYHQVGRGCAFDRHPFKDWEDVELKDQVIVFARAATKYCCFSIVPNTYIYSDSLCVVAKSGLGLFATLSSDVHCVWAWEHGSKMKQDLRYSHGDIFETFPFADGVLEDSIRALSELGGRFLYLRSHYMQENNKGLTKTYNDFHDPSTVAKPVKELRELQEEINITVLNSYGFNDLDLDHGFHKVAYLPKGKNTRFTISESAREELLYRLALLNKSRHELEEQG